MGMSQQMGSRAVGQTTQDYLYQRSECWTEFKLQPARALQNTDTHGNTETVVKVWIAKCPQMY